MSARTTFCGGAALMGGLFFLLIGRLITNRKGGDERNHIVPFLPHFHVENPLIMALVCQDFRKSLQKQHAHLRMPLN